MKVYYRISDNSYRKIKLPGSTKELCLINFIGCFPDADLTIVADNVLPETIDMIKRVMGSYSYELLVTQLSNAGSFVFSMKKAIELPDSTVVYMVEDDYLHFAGDTPFGHRNPARIVEEGVKLANYATLFDHPDKYQEEYSFGEISKVYRTDSTHWRTTISTCMTFATKVGQLKEDFDVWERYTKGTHPHDHQIFLDLNRSGKTLVECIPGLAFHTDLTYPLQKSNLVDKLIEPWAIEIVSDDLRVKIKEKTGKDVDSSVVTGYKKLMLLDVYLQQ